MSKISDDLSIQDADPQQRSFFSCLFFLFLILTCVSDIAFAQTPPSDAGALMQQIEQERQKMMQERQLPSPEVESAIEQEPTKEEMKVTVKSFRFEGNILLTDDELAVVVESYLNHPITYTELQKAAAAVGEAYRKRGWAVRSFLPQQDIVDGVVTINIVEAKFGKVQIEKESYSWPSFTTIEGMVADQQKKNQPLNTKKLERALLLIDDLPGATASGRLQQGEQEGETDLIIKTAREPIVSGAMILDNEGSRSTEEKRVHSFLQFANPYGIGDWSSIYLLYSEGLRFARLEQTLPLGTTGWRVGANANLIDYEIIPSEFEALDGHGQSTSIGAQASYPIVRARQKNLNFNANFDHKYFDNSAQDATSSKYKIDNYTLAMRGNMVDDFAGGGNSYAGFSIVLGNIDLGTANSGEDTSLDGAFQKFMYNISRQQTIFPKIAIYAALSGQYSQEHKLDSSEKFYLGGPNGVRAYPVSEGGGVIGRLLTTELRWRFLPNFQLSAFYDYGHVKNYGDIQSYSLEGAGMELAWQSKKGFSVKVTWAHRIGSNPNPTTTGVDQDGSLIEDRFWLRFSQQF